MIKEIYKIEKWDIENDSIGSEFWKDTGFVDQFKISSGDFSAFEKNILDHGFLEDFENCLKTLESLGKKVCGIGIELAAGTMWLTAFILKKFKKNIKNFYALEMSESFLYKLAPLVLKQYQVSPDHLTMCHGSFYDIKLPAETLDFVVMCQAFHHADDPNRLLKEIYRVLKKGGFLIMIGELFIPKALYFKCYLNYLISLLVGSKYFPIFLKKNFKIFNRLGFKFLTGSFQELYFPSDKLTGDHYHLRSQYENFFRRNKFSFFEVKSKLKNHLSYVLVKRS